MRKKTTAELVAEKPAREVFSRLPKTPITLVVDGIRALDNVGLLFRIADGFRIRELILCGITGYPAGLPGDTRPAHVMERHDRHIKKTAIQTIPYVPWTYRPDAAEIVREKKAAGDMVVALEQVHGSRDYRAVTYRLPVTLVVGHEREGVAQPVLDIADVVVEIPMRGMGNSHNVAIATALTLHEMTRTK